jgi:hypothetical protein
MNDNVLFSFYMEKGKMVDSAYTLNSEIFDAISLEWGLIQLEPAHT